MDPIVDDENANLGERQPRMQTLFGVYIRGLPSTVSKGCGCADGLAVLAAGPGDGGILGRNISALAMCLRRWRLGLGEEGAVSVIFGGGKRDVGWACASMQGVLAGLFPAVGVLRDSGMGSWRAEHSSADLWVRSGERAHLRSAPLPWSQQCAFGLPDALSRQEQPAQGPRHTYRLKRFHSIHPVVPDAFDEAHLKLVRNGSVSLAREF